jgi:hypothetical protein
MTMSADDLHRGEFHQIPLAAGGCIQPSSGSFADAPSADGRSESAYQSSSGFSASFARHSAGMADSP